MPRLPLRRSIVAAVVTGVCAAGLAGCSSVTTTPSRTHAPEDGPRASTGGRAAVRSAVRTVAFGRSRGRDVAVTAGADGLVRVRWLPTLEPAAGPLPGDRAAVAELDGRSVVFTVGGYGGRLWDLDTRRELLHVPAPVSAFAFGALRGAPALFTGDRRGRVRIWDLASGTSAGSLDTGAGTAITALASARVRSRPILVVAVDNHGDDPGHAQLWDLTTRHRTGAVLPARQEAESFDRFQVLTLDGRPTLVTGSDYGLRRWDLERRQELGPSVENRQEDARLFSFPSFTVALDGRRPVLVTGRVAGAPIQLRDPADGAVLAEMAVRPGTAVTALAAGTVNGDQVLLSGDEDGTVRLWDLRTRGRTDGPAPTGGS
ncbi:WD40 repeat domain-containing protein [Streptosporangium jomthongense]|uniref:WD40 repeat domain-containing protein n=1 Tax=Streptosporangium jomthongense TaxID=1193683 RepID=A0ABV8FDD9_9ACTN